jgi:hypothetical protein
MVPNMSSLENSSVKFTETQVDRQLIERVEIDKENSIQ